MEGQKTEGQKIKVLIDGRSYKYVVDSALQEQVIRKAAASVNDLIQSLSVEFKGVSPVDIVTIAALTESIGRVQAEMSRTDDDGAYGKLAADLANYVESLK